MPNLKIFTGLCLILILGASTLFGSFVDEAAVNFFFSSEIAILFDNTDTTTERVAYRIYEVVEQCYSDVQRIPISSVKGLRDELNLPNWVFVYVFHGKMEGMTVGSEEVSWEELGRLLEASSAKHHVIEACHSVKLEETLNYTEIHGIGAGIDAELATLHALCRILEIFENSKEAEQVEASRKISEVVGLHIITNLPEIVQKAIYPIEPLGDGLAQLLLNVTDEPFFTGPWGWLMRFLFDNWLTNKITSAVTWFNVFKDENGTHIAINLPEVQKGVLAVTEVKKKDLGKGKQDSGIFPFDIPLNVSVEPKWGKGPWYFPDYVDLKFSVFPEHNLLDLTDTPLTEVLEAAGYDVTLKLEPKLWGALRVGNFLPEIVESFEKGTCVLCDLPAGSGASIQFMGGGFSISFHFELGIPLATFLDYIITGTGAVVSKVLKILQIKINLLNTLDLLTGIGYNYTAECSMENILLKFGIGFLIEAKIPSLKKLIKKAIGVSLPLGFIQLGMKLRGTTGVEVGADFGPKGDIFKVGLFYNLFFKFWAKLFWFLKFSWGKEWKGMIPFYENLPETQQSNNHTSLDFDEDGLWDNIEPMIGTSNKTQDTDNDGLSDGNEVYEFFTNPILNDTDGDGLLDGDEMAHFFLLNLDPLADYDGDGLPCILDPDSDNDGLTDRQEILGVPYDAYWQRYIKTDPSLPDTDFDGLTDYEEKFKWGDSSQEWPHTDPTKRDTDDDGLLDGAEDQYWEGRHKVPTIEYLLDPDSDDDLLLDGEELKYGTDPLDIDTDGDYDLNNNGIIDPWEELLARADYPAYPGDLTDYGEIKGNYWPGGPFGGSPPCAYPWPVPTNPIKNDTDGDELLDYEEWLEGTNPMYLDSDSDGLSNDEEYYIYQTNCTDPDTDDDGLMDGFERDYFWSKGIPDEVIREAGYLNDPDVDDDGLIDGLDNEFQIGTDILNPDTDEDQLLDGQEVEMGTYPLNNDTDGDTLLDGVEVHVYGTNPKRQDTDNDGLADPIEVNKQHLDLLNVGSIDYETDPRDPDTDDDGICDGEEVYGWSWAIDRMVPPESTEIPPPVEPPSTLKIHYAFPDPYRARFQTNPVNNDTDRDGLTDGQEKEMVLSPLTSDTDGDEIVDVLEIDAMMNKFQTDDWRILPDTWHYLDYDRDGLSDLDETIRGTDLLWNDTDDDGLSDWQEVSMPISFNKTTFDERGPGGNVTIVANMTGTGIYTDPLNRDTDGDGIWDGDELNLHGTDPTLPDTDGDGLTDYQELFEYRIVRLGPNGSVVLRPDPLDPDTDGDGLVDGEEVEYFTERLAESGNQSFGPLGDFDSDGLLNILDPDSDFDGIYDGVELKNYTQPTWPWHPIGTDPLAPDQDSNGVKDGKQTDYDQDGLSDYREVYETPPGYTQPGIVIIQSETSDPWAGAKAEGYQHLLNHTLFLLSDTDNDTFSDGDEVLKYYTDPLNPESVPYQHVHWAHWNGRDYLVEMLTHSSITDFNFNQEQKQITFNVEGPEGTKGSCNVTIPKSMLDAPTDQWIVLFDGAPTSPEVKSNATHTSLYFPYNHSNHQVIIQGTWVVPEFPSSILLLLFLIATLILIIIKRKTRLKLRRKTHVACVRY